MLSNINISIIYDMTAIRPSYLYSGNPYTWKGGLYIETEPKDPMIMGQ